PAGPAFVVRGSLRRRRMAGSSPAMTEERARFHIRLPGNLFVQVAPVRIHREDEINLPLSRPMLDVLFSLDCGGSRVVVLIVNQHLNAIAFGEARHEALSMLKGSTDPLIGAGAGHRPG